MKQLSLQQKVELFHLVFLRHFGTKVDKKLYVLKGGSNLRFFLKSIRYSEDMDLDVRTIGKSTLKKNVNNILKGTNLSQSLQIHGISIGHISEAKQTETTQRWKIQLQVAGGAPAIPTKIEFSRRGFDKGTLFESVDPEITLAYKLTPILMNHYSKEVAIAQKIEALIHRAETQARDIFDLKLLFDAGVQQESLRSFLTPQICHNIDKACDNAMSITFDDFKGQVTAYLPPDFQDYYNSRHLWDQILEKVLSILQELAQ